MINAIKVEIISLKARMKKAADFCLNNDMHVERQLLSAQIKALENELEEQKGIKDAFLKFPEGDRRHL